MVKIAAELAVELVSLTHEMADAARETTLLHFRRSGLEAGTKARDHFDPVTVADCEAEMRMRAILARRRPQDAILGEEMGAQIGSSGLTWVLDPIDGTRAFLAGIPTWGVLVAVAGPGMRPLYGVIDQPYIGERFMGGFGTSQMTGPRGTASLAVRAARPLAECIIMTTFPEVGNAAEGAAFHRLARQCRLTRYGADCYAYALLAAGQIDLVVEAGLQAYDIQAPMAVIEAAGGIVTNWTGGPAQGGGRVIAASSAAVHAAALALLAE
ncbi:MAG: inositol monophosphatase family protein [Gemmobacter sp.]|jgi:histidinol phosphatase-like enzyme (inositol monophosphatase family)|nr:inositol monophosphatase family protein [Gemmobacter sp.]